MKKTHVLLALASCLCLCEPQLRAEQLDDLITGLKSGAKIDPDERANILKTTHAAASKSYNDGTVALYLWEIKCSIVDPDKNAGWPYRSFLVEDDPIVRSQLLKALKGRFEEKPDSILAYALICPAIYAGDDKLVEQLQSYLKDNDPFLYEIEQAHVDKIWRPYIKTILEKEAAGKK